MEAAAGGAPGSCRFKPSWTGQSLEMVPPSLKGKLTDKQLNATICPKSFPSWPPGSIQLQQFYTGSIPPHQGWNLDGSSTTCTCTWFSPPLSVGDKCYRTTGALKAATLTKQITFIHFILDDCPTDDLRVCQSLSAAPQSPSSVPAPLASSAEFATGLPCPHQTHAGAASGQGPSHLCPSAMLQGS